MVHSASAEVVPRLFDAKPCSAEASSIACRTYFHRAHPGKETTNVVDFVNEAADIVEAFQLYHTTAELQPTTDPNLVTPNQESCRRLSLQSAIGR